MVFSTVCGKAGQVPCSEPMAEITETVTILDDIKAQSASGQGAASEASAAGWLRTIATTSVVYSSTYNQGFAGSLSQLGPPHGGCRTMSSNCADLLDPVLSGVNPATAIPAKSG